MIYVFIPASLIILSWKGSEIGFSLREARITVALERRLMASLSDWGPRLGVDCAVL